MGISLLQTPPSDAAQLQYPGGVPDLASYRKTPVYDADCIFYVEQMNAFLAAAKLDFPESLGASREVATRCGEAKPKGYALSAMLLASVDKVLEREAAAVAELRAGQSAIAVERYRLAHGGALPSSLDALVPQFLAAVPADPFDGKPLHYKPLIPKGFVVYSCGLDKEDNGGAPKPPGAQTGVPFDIPFAVKR